MITSADVRYIQLLINEALFETFPSEVDGATSQELPTDVLSLLRRPDLNIPEFVESILNEYADVDERTIRNIVDRFPSSRARQRAPDTSMMDAYISKFTMVLSSTPTIKSKYL